jgi:hypothetical protein
MNQSILTAVHQASTTSIASSIGSATYLQEKQRDLERRRGFMRK